MTSQSEYAHAAERFRKDTTDHQMTVLHDDGLFRHIRFEASGGAWFTLTTWPQKLVVNGTVGTYVFSRMEDMFEFFRSSLYFGGPNFGYWEEKVIAASDGPQSYSQELFDKQVAEYLAEAEKDWPGVTAAWKDKVDPDIWYPEYNTEYEDDARRALNDFEFGATYQATCSCGASETVTDYTAGYFWERSHCRSAGGDGDHQAKTERVPGFQFYDTHEWKLRDFDWKYLWCCHAIVWGIARYDEATRPAEAVAS